MTDRVEWIRNTLTAALQPLHLSVQDDSALHAGHAGAASGGGHYSVVVVSQSFRGRSLIERQRAVYAALGEAMRKEIHALALRTLTPEEWQPEAAAGKR